MTRVVVALVVHVAVAEDSVLAITTHPRGKTKTYQLRIGLAIPPLTMSRLSIGICIYIYIYTRTRPYVLCLIF